MFSPSKIPSKTPSKRIRTLVLTGYGINCEEETAMAFTRAGSTVEILHLNELQQHKDPFAHFSILSIPGGFSYGDHIASGRVFANKLIHRYGDSLLAFIQKKRPVLAICNGFQILIKAGILPGFPKETTSSPFHQDMSLVTNTSGLFENRWVTLIANLKNPSFWLHQLRSGILRIPVRHGEGRIVPKNQATMDTLLASHQIAFQYAGPAGLATEKYPANPNGSPYGIAALTNAAGNVLGIMPHPEAASYPEQDDITYPIPSLVHPALSHEHGVGMSLFFNAVLHADKQKWYH